ncbi:MAG TPA: hypothetical protein VGF20_13445, partial [Candidatus Acidoferrum sp.]
IGLANRLLSGCGNPGTQIPELCKSMEYRYCAAVSILRTMGSQLPMQLWLNRSCSYGLMIGFGAEWETNDFRSRSHRCRPQMRSH